MSQTATVVETSSAGRFADYMELTKPRLSALSVITTLVGYLAAKPEHDLARLLATVGGAAACAAGVAALNQWMERDTDALMRRTADRPLPAGRLQDGSAFVLGTGACIVGLGVLFARVGGPAAGCALLTIITYLALYTPAKKWTRWSTELGAVSGALPPLIGWTAAHGHGPLGWILFAVLFLWQIPHFMAISWLYREDYAAARFPMLPVLDASGHDTSRWALVHAGLLGAVALLPAVLGIDTWIYGAVAAGLGGWMLLLAARFCRSAQRDVSARKLFYCTLLFLPLLLGALVADQWWLAP